MKQTPTVPSTVFADSALARRTRIDRIKLFMVSGITQRKMTDMLLREGLFPAHTGHPPIPDGETCGACYGTLRGNVRDAIEEMDGDAKVHPGAARFVYIQRQERIFSAAMQEFERAPTVERMTTTTTTRRGGQAVTVTDRMEDRKFIKSQMLKQAADAAERVANAQGVDTRKPLEVKLPEKWRVFINEDGVAELDKQAPEYEDAPTN